jgi:hypothetical protein
MVVSKCKRCRAEIPEEAAFCPACGAPKPEELPPESAPKSQPVPQQAPQPTQTAQPVQPKLKKSSGAGFQGLIDTFLSMKMMLLVILIGILVAWIALIVDQFYPTTNNVDRIMTILNFTFMAGVGGILLFGGLLNNKFDKYIKLALIVAGGLILATSL